MAVEGFRLQTRSGTNLVAVDADLNTRVTFPEDPVDAGAWLAYVPRPGASGIQSFCVGPDYRLAQSQINALDIELFNYGSQNTGKHNYDNSVMTAAWDASLGLRTNAGNIVGAGTGLVVRTYAFFPVQTADTFEVNAVVAFPDQPATNTTIDFGLFLPAGSGFGYAPTDGVYFRLTSAGFFGVINYDTVETVSSAFTFAHTNDQRYLFAMRVTPRSTRFYIDDQQYAEVLTPATRSWPFRSAALPFALRHAIVGSDADAVLEAQVGSYAIQLGGAKLTESEGTIGNRIFGSYQGLSGLTTGAATGEGLASYENSANPAAVLPTNSTTCITGLGGQAAEDDTQAVDTDCIICNYQVLNTSLTGVRRLRLTQVVISSFVSGALTGGGYVAQWSLAFGHTNIDLATVEAPDAKEPRRIALGVQTVAANAVANTVLSRIRVRFSDPVFVEPGQFIAAVKKKVGTAPSAGTITHLITYDYSWE